MNNAHFGPDHDPALGYCCVAVVIDVVATSTITFPIVYGMGKWEGGRALYPLIVVILKTAVQQRDQGPRGQHRGQRQGLG